MAPVRYNALTMTQAKDTDSKHNNIPVDIKAGENATVTITGSQPWEKLADYKERALDHAVEHVEIDGFRKGKAPREKVEQQLDSMRLLSEAAQNLLADIYPAIVLQNDIKVIGSPDINITKLADNNPLEFVITTATFPTIELADYKKVAADTNSEELAFEVTDKDVQDSIDQVLSMNSSAPTEEGGEPTKPELTDEFVKTLGEFENVDDFKAKLRENLKMQKKQEAQAKRREAMMLELIEKSSFSMPELLVTSEQEKMIAQMKDDVMRMGLEYSEYLKHMKKTEEELKAEWRDDAVKRASSELILKEIARVEEIKPNAEKVNQQVEMIKEQYGESVPEQNIRLYVESIFINEAVLGWLEEQK